MGRVKEFGVKWKFLGKRYTKTDGKNFASTKDAIICYVDVNDASSSYRRKLSDIQSDWDECFCVNKHGT
jgi:hypothetical protein